VNLTTPFGGDTSLNTDFNIYRTTDTGDKLAGDISNTAFSLATALSFLKAHTFTLAFQKVNGDTPFDYVGVGKNNRGGDSIFLANSIQYSDFNGPGEKSLQARYDLKMAEYGVPGLSFMVRYVKGWDIDGTGHFKQHRLHRHCTAKTANTTKPTSKPSMLFSLARRKTCPSAFVKLGTLPTPTKAKATSKSSV
jgi:hypothetical protein